jgi:predicted nucleic acid-binding protein
MATVYLDVCCLNRPFDDQSQDRIRLESEAVRLILARISSGELSWMVGEVMEEEIERTADPVRRGRTRLMLSYAETKIVLGDAEVARGEELQALGFQAYDALHLACAESAAADVFLTTDDRLLRTARRSVNELRIGVANPLDFEK